MASVPRRRGLASAAACLAGVAVMAAVPGSAAAEPRPSLHRVQVRVDQLHREAGDAAERYNDARVKLADANRRLTVVRHRLESQQSTTDAMQASVDRLAAASYKSGGVDTTLQVLLADDPESFLQSVTALDRLGRSQSETLTRVVAARQKLASSRLAMAQEQARATAISKQIAAQKRSVEQKLASAKALLGTLRADQRAQLNSATKAASARGRAVASRSRAGDIPNYEGPASGRAATAIKAAFAQLGDPYVYGAAGPGSFDCSGLTMFAWGAAGVSLPHSSAAQYSAASPVSSSSLEPGDLVFYYSPISHVGIYIGGGRIIHAPHPGRSVEIVGLHSMPYVGAARP
ncbi:MAG: peptidoglycan DL-endopeptidase CwlO [Actinomycetota bacterium]|nr:peptidoglycan DL-endopeptidase CwlO [Actinomycetota bacterium]